MGKVVFPRPAAPVLGVTPSIRAAKIEPAAPADAPEAPEGTDLRLMIEEAEVTGVFVYTIVDRKTGKVVSRLTREEVLRLKEKASYAAGAVFDGKA